jgi:hypothetical protein
MSQNFVIVSIILDGLTLQNLLIEGVYWEKKFLKDNSKQSWLGPWPVHSSWGFGMDGPTVVPGYFRAYPTFLEKI